MNKFGHSKVTRGILGWFAIFYTIMNICNHFLDPYAHIQKEAEDISLSWSYT